jgi:hypothetical protein
MKRIKELMDKTSWGWIVALGMVPALVSACAPTTSEVSKGDLPQDAMVFADRATGCQYLTTQERITLTPRIANDGKTHMGCKGAQQ